MVFKPRLSLPLKEENNPYFFLKKEGGRNPCIDVSKESDAKVKSSVYKGAANCVWLANARYNECQQTKEGEWKLGSWNAKDFIEKAKAKGLPVSKTPMVGSVMVWGAKGTNEYGHVEFVEAYNEKTGEVTTSSSGYNSYVYKVRKRNNNNLRWGQGSNYPFLGFVNPFIEFNMEEEMTQEQFNEFMDNWIKEQNSKEASSYAADALKWGKENKVISGDEKGNLMPRSFVTRQDLMIILKRILGK